MGRPGFFTRAGMHRMLEGTPAHAGRRAVRIGLAVLILLNVGAVILESVEQLNREHAKAFRMFEIASVAVFSVEYLLRLWVCVEDPRYSGRFGRLRFALSPLALVDLLAILPSYLAGLLAIDTRMLRALRLLRIFKLTRHSTSMDLLLTVLRQEAPNFLSSVLVMLIVILLAATGMYAIEREAQPQAFGSIPKAVWWAAVTLTTVGYGDVVPQTVIGKVFGLVITVAGVGMVALPAGILASGFSLELQRRREAYTNEVRRALTDGRVSRREMRRLERHRDELGLSRSEAQLLMQCEEASRRDEGATCPHCGELLDEPAAEEEPPP